MSEIKRFRWRVLPIWVLVCSVGAGSYAAEEKNAAVQNLSATAVEKAVPNIEILNERKNADSLNKVLEETIAEAKVQEHEKSENEKELLASLIFCEAGNQSFAGQVAVGAVVLNRMQHDAYPDEMEAVIYQDGQFCPAESGWLDRIRDTSGYTESAMEAAEAALDGENPIGDCLFFDQGGYGYQIGAHYFH